jgi:hypothetical protein
LGALAVFTRPEASPQALRDLWADLLVDAPDGASFFEAGGRSLDLLRLIEQIREVYGVVVSLEALLDRPTADGMAEVVSRALDATAFELEAPLPPVGDVPPTRPSAGCGCCTSSTGERTWSGGGPRSTGCSTGPRSRGAWTPWSNDMSACERRSTSPGARWSRACDPRARASRSSTSGTAPDAEAALAALTDGDALMAGFDLEAGRVARFLLARLADDVHRLLVASPHVTGDAWAVDLIGAELWSCYASGGQAGALPPVRVTPARVAAWEVSPAVAARRSAAVEAWVARLKGAVPTELPTELPRPAHPTGRAGHLTVELAEARSGPGSTRRGRAEERPSQPCSPHSSR